MSRRAPQLPEYAADFVDSLRATLKPSSCLQYAGALRAFHEWLKTHGYSVTTLTRQQTSRWLRHLAALGRAPVTRVNVINSVRAYLRALNDAGLLAPPADELLRTSDLPKIPVYLPRPLSPAIDQELQRRLEKSPHRYHRGLLVMRNTGLRVGELCQLSIDCIWDDDGGNVFLKVPLGKMNTERLVPLDEKTHRLVRELQRTGRPGRKLLLETEHAFQTRRGKLTLALRAAATGLTIPGGLTTHRLRHTYATTLLGAGMSLTSIMKLLGHTDYRMTLRYAAITLETVGTEYRAALTQLEVRYQTALTTPRLALAPLDPDAALQDLILWVQKRATDDQRQSAALLVKRLRRLRDELREL
jgi:integrase